MAKITKEEFYELCKYSSAEIVAQKLGVSISRVYQRLKEFNLGTPFIKKRDFDFTIFEKIDTEDKAYWLGFLYADVCIRAEKERWMVYLELGKKDLGHLEKFRNFINPKLDIKYRKDKGTYFICLNSKKVVQDLIKLGCTPRKSFTLKFPTEEQIPKHLMNSFILGYFDGDGYITRDKNRDTVWSIGFVGSFDFIESLRSFLIQSGIIVNPVYKHGKIYKLVISKKENLNKVLDFMYAKSGVYLDRKFDRYKASEQDRNSTRYSKCQSL